MDVISYAERVCGCLLGGALGDALGAPVEFDSTSTIVSAYGQVRSFLPNSYGPLGAVTDDTQMTLFTVEGLVQAGRRHRPDHLDMGFVHAAYLRWLGTQRSGPLAADDQVGLAGQRWLYSRRAPGLTCLGALGAATATPGPAANDSKGCGGVMRSAPFGLLPADSFTAEQVLDYAHTCAAFTHGHPTGQVSSAGLAGLVYFLAGGADLAEAVFSTVQALERLPHHQQTTSLLSAAVEAASDSPGSLKALESLGEGWVGEEALAIGAYAALSFPQPGQVLDALALAVSHGGDSDSTGSICGNILGTLHGQGALPSDLASQVEAADAILAVADEFVAAFS